MYKLPSKRALFESLAANDTSALDVRFRHESIKLCRQMPIAEQLPVEDFTESTKLSPTVSLSFDPVFLVKL